MPKAKFFNVSYIDSHQGKAHKKVCCARYLDELNRFIKNGQFTSLFISPATESEADEYAKLQMDKINKYNVPGI